jgi:hypothetical protein
MRRPNIKLHIEELVLHGVAPNDRYAIGDAVERELSRLLAAGFDGSALPTSLAANSDRPRIDGGSFHVATDAKPNSIGVHIAQAVHEGITR